jgi:ABC-type branched-subunit amino acid transport system substrate-binding protein
MTGRSWAAWAGVKILGESILRAGSPAPDKLVPYLRDSLQFDGYMGESMNFRPWNQQLRQKLVIVQVNHQAAANGWDALTLETLVPLRRLKGWEGDPLDSIGFSAKESGCTF